MTYVWWSERGELPPAPEPEPEPAVEAKPIEYTEEEQLVNRRVATARRRGF